MLRLDLRVSPDPTDDQLDGRVDICASAFVGQILHASDDLKLERLESAEQLQAVQEDFASRRAASCVGQAMPCSHGVTICEGECRLKER